jgi:hypothetical protein
VRPAEARHFAGESMFIPAVRTSSAWSRPRGEGLPRNQRNNPRQNKLPMHLSRRCGARTRSGSLCRSPAMPNGRCRLQGRMSPGAPVGNKNSFKHGRYAAETIANRREIATLLRTMRALARTTGERSTRMRAGNSRCEPFQNFCLCKTRDPKFLNECPAF